MISSTTRPSLLGLLSIVILCIPFHHHVYSFQSMYIVSPGARTDGFALQTIDRFSSSFVSPLKLSASTLSEESNSTSLKAATKSKKKKSKYTIQWEKTFDLLAAYNERGGDANVPNSHIEEGVNLGWWLRRQREFYKTRKLLPERQRKLESLGVEWNPFENHWEMMVDLLTSYIEREGHAVVPQDHEEGGQNLGNWLRFQRRLYRAGKLPPERRRKLESLGVEWDGTSAREAMRKKRWERMFNLLCMYEEREGHVIVPIKHREEGENLCSWISYQRTLYKTGDLHVERQNKLESLGVDLKRKRKPNRQQMMWERKFNLLAAYKEREGHANVPDSHKEEGVKLGIWLKNQRHSYKDGTLLAVRQHKLESLGVEWDGNVVQAKRSEMQWQSMFDLLCKCKEREGNANVPSKHIEDGESLGIWLESQRVLYKDGTLLVERQSKLESLGVEWDFGEVSLEMQWQSMFNLLAAYKEREGNANVPQKHIEDGENLGMWLSRQRMLYRAGKLKAERQRKLESLGVKWKLR